MIWATGYRRAYPWLHVPVLNAAGEIQQSTGRTPAPGLLVIGMRSQTRRSSTFLDGVRHDAALVVDYLINGALAGSGNWDVIVVGARVAGAASIGRLAGGAVVRVDHVPVATAG